MSEDNNKEINKKKKKKGKGKKVFKRIFLALLILIVIGIGVSFGIVMAILKDVPEIDPSAINASLNETSFILTQEGDLVEKIQAHEFRTVVSSKDIPQHLKDAFIAIEDERFESHIGIDPRGIASSMIDNIKAGKIVRGASTITQQLVKNVYLTNEKTWDRKIKEAYLAIQLEKALTKDQILEAYLNRIYLGQNAYGVHEAAQTYFSKDLNELTIAESAIIAGIVKSTSAYPPYKVLRPEDFNPEAHEQIAQLEILDEKYIAIFNPDSVKRQKLVLSQMLKTGRITETQYQQALAEDIKANIKPAQKKVEGISSYFSDYVKTQVVQVLMREFGYSYERAQTELFTGGLKIYSTIDLKLQRELEAIYDNFTEILAGDPNKIKGPILVDWRLNKSGDVIDENGKIIYYKKANLFNDNFELVINKDSYSFVDENLVIKSKKLNPYPKHIDVTDYYTIDDKKNLVTFTVGSITPPEGEFSIGENKEVTFKSSYLKNNPDFYRIDENGNLLISDNHFYRSKTGIVQPQSASVVLDYRTGQIKALVGGRDVKGSSILNRATASQRQPGSAMKPIATYLPALDNGFTAASAIDDIPFYSGGKLWPKNWYRDRYRGLYPLRKAVEQSSNIVAVKVVDQIGIKTSMSYLEKMGIINPADPENDSFITAKENPKHNDENLSALGLGGMTKGLTPLEVTAAFGSIANDGTYIEPMTFTKIEDRNGNILVENFQKKNTVTSPQVAYIMKDILRTTVTNGIASKAKISNMATAGKTGTTTDQADIWFVGFTPYYVTGVWIGNDSPQITISKGSGTAIQLWKNVMNKAHDGLEPKGSFAKPDGIVSASVCNQSGLLPSDLCSRDPRGTVVSEIFAKGTVPTKTCDVHVEARIDTSTGKLANEFCPESSVQSQVFIKRNPPYIPSEHDGLVPTDFSYSLPTATCDVHNVNNTGPVTEEDQGDEPVEFPFGEENDGQVDPNLPETNPGDNNNGNQGEGNGSVKPPTPPTTPNTGNEAVEFPSIKDND